MQLWTGHVPLAHHLCRIQVADMGIRSGCKWSNETVIHFLLHCLVHERARQKLVNALGIGGCNIGYLLSHPKAIIHTIQFLDDTGRLSHIYKHVNATADQKKQLHKLA